MQRQAQLLVNTVQGKTIPVPKNASDGSDVSLRLGSTSCQPAIY
jgi:hypothetical protein